MKPKKILLTGGSGFIGYNIAYCSLFVDLLRRGGVGFKEPTRILTRVKKEFLSPIIHKKTRCLAGDGTVDVDVWRMDETDRAGPA